MTADLCRAREIAASVTDPELPALTLADLGVLRDVTVDESGRVLVTLTPTYSGCPAMATMREDLVRELRAHGYDRVEIRISLTPPWSSDWITAEGRRKLSAAGYSVPGPAPRRATGPIPLTLTATRRAVECPRCTSSNTVRVSEFGASLCKAQYRCADCLEPFDHLKEI
ncbi:ring-1,2-phenylacetyl-CoA epoxidase subunit PaaD [Nocardia tenerifensis]|uniref:Ring-1,2-phenylacetyl-CoA epoxidase subunit PaaD n=1 Tax=Nocardia tenerifensis TaxID=228006 RepID=A0A318JP14_9NOCA